VEESSAATDWVGVAIKGANCAALVLFAAIAVTLADADTPPNDPWGVRLAGGLLALYGFVWLAILIDACRRHDHYRRLFVTLAGGLLLLLYPMVQAAKVVAAL
jgi:threonine/homoserine/homoserine lactone efflux protein